MPDSFDHVFQDRACFVRVAKGRTRSGVMLNDVTVNMIQPAKTDKDGIYITADGHGVPGLRAGRNRIYLEDLSQISYVGPHAPTMTLQPAAVRSDDDIRRELTETFAILEDMSRAVAANVVKGLVVSGPAGIGKSYTVESTLQRTLDLLGRMNGMGQMYEVISGGCSASMLVEKLYSFREDGQVLVFDDCDGVLHEDDCLNLLKAALDSKKTRRISYNHRSIHLERAGIPHSFEYRGGIVFITNVKFDQLRSERLKNHLEAIVSRCHYMDIGIDTAHEKLLHIRNTVERHDMLRDYDFTDAQKAEVLDYITEHSHKLRELSLRMVLKISDMRKAMPGNWKAVVAKSCHRKAA